jgi:hypothetical protein
MTQVTPNTEKAAMQSPQEQLSNCLVNCMFNAERYREASRNLHDALDELRDLVLTDDKHLFDLLHEEIVGIEEAGSVLDELCDKFEKLDDDLIDKISTGD